MSQIMSSFSKNDLLLDEYHLQFNFLASAQLLENLGSFFHCSEFLVSSDRSHAHVFSFFFFFLQSVCFFCISFDCCFTTVRFFYYSTRNTLQSCTPFLASSLETIAFLLVSCLRGSSFSFGTLALLFPCTMKQTCFLIQKNKGMSSCRLYTDCTSLLAENILIYSGKSKIGRCCINLMVILCLYLFFCIG